MAPASTIPEGHALVSGRSKAQAILLLELADEVDEPRRSVRAIREGYIVPSAIADAYEKRAAEQAEADGGADGSDAIAVPDGSTERHEGAVSLEGAGNAPAGDGDVPPATEPVSETSDAGTEASSDEAKTEAAPEPPAKNARTEAWEDFAKVHHGYDPNEGLGRDELIAKYGDE